MKIAVFYKSVSGFTATYAKWIAEEVNADIYQLKEASADLLCKYDIIVYGGSLHMVGISGYKKFKNYLSQRPKKQLILFTTGASPQKKDTIEEVKNRNLTKAEQVEIPFYYLRGGFNFNKLNMPNKILMTLFKWKLSLTKNKTPDMLGMLEAYSTPMDFTQKDMINEIVSKVKCLSCNNS